MFSTRVCEGKAFAGEQKREFKKVLLKGKRIQTKLRKKIKPNDLIRKATYNLNKTRPIKYGFTPKHMEEKILKDNIFIKLYNFQRLFKVKDNKDSLVRFEERKDNRKKRKLRDLLDIGEKVLVIAERLKRKMHQVIYIKIQLKISCLIIGIGVSPQIREFWQIMKILITIGLKKTTKK